MSIYYLVSSLPYFNFGDKPFYSSESFVRLCADWINASEQKELAEISLVPSRSSSEKSSFVTKWNDYIGALANSLAKIRAGKLGRDISATQLENTSVFSEVEKAVQDAFAAENPMEKEKILDRLKWYIIDQLEAGHQFDFDKLCAYKLRILLCENWIQRKEKEGSANLDSALAGLYTPSDEK